MNYYDKVKNELEQLIDKFKGEQQNFEKNFKRLEKQEKNLAKQSEELKQLARERQIGFPSLARAYDEYFKLQDKSMIDFLKYKNQPAIKASEIAKEQSRMRRQAEQENKINKFVIEYYESIAPFLIDLKEELEIGDEDKEFLSDYTEEERKDEVTNFLTKEEYRKLSSVERNQMALDRYWHRPKSKWLIGKLYERYVGQIFEEEGYQVDYIGIFKGFEDLGRDLICKNEQETVVVQCKNWSKFKTIYEKHIFQFFGTVFEYKDKNPNENVRAIFYSSTKLSDLARRFSKELGIELKEDFKFDTTYPCIKCNISTLDGTKIYHLPFDQQYDRTKIEKHKGEFYCSTVKEAEEAGFRRAFRHKITKQ